MKSINKTEKEKQPLLKERLNNLAIQKKDKFKQLKEDLNKLKKMLKKK